MGPDQLGLGKRLYLVGGDYTGDGLADLYAVQDGSIYLEPGTSGGGIGSARFVSAGWGGVSLVGGGNFSGAGGVDLLGAHPASDSMYLHTNNNDGLGTLVGAQPVDTGWAHYVGADGRLVVGSRRGGSRRGLVSERDAVTEQGLI